MERSPKKHVFSSPHIKTLLFLERSCLVLKQLKNQQRRDQTTNFLNSKIIVQLWLTYGEVKLLSWKQTVTVIQAYPCH